MAKIKGTQGPDSLSGTASRDVMIGLRGDDALDGQGGNDWLFGGRGNDDLTGGNGHDRLFGGKNDDNLFGGAGNDWVDGGRGFDTAVFNGDFADYTITEHHNHLHVSGTDGNDRLTHVERLQFADGYYDVASGTFLNPDGTLDASAQDPSSPGNIYPGSGIPASDWVVAQSTTHDIELGLQVIYRKGPAVNPTGVEDDGTVNFTVADGPQSTANGSSINEGYAAWSFEYSVSTALNGSSDTLAAYDLRLLIDLDPSADTSFLELKFVPTGGLPDTLTEPRSNGAWELASPMAGVPLVGTDLILDDGGTTQVTQNSQNYLFYSTIMDFDGNPATDDAALYTFTPGEFDIYLQAFDPLSGDLLLQNHVNVTVA